jgi:hypothetical protein
MGQPSRVDGKASLQRRTNPAPGTMLRSKSYAWQAMQGKVGGATQRRVSQDGKAT